MCSFCPYCGARVESPGAVCRDCYADRCPEYEARERVRMEAADVAGEMEKADVI